MSEEQLRWEPAAGHGDQVLSAVDGPLGRVRLNRPRAINALDRASVDSLRQVLTDWAEEDGVHAVLIDGAGERGLCAGGDVRALREAILAGDVQLPVDYWAAEYALNQQVADFPKPYIAWMDGIVMGGGLGVSTHGSVRLVTERTQLAMPEVIIGFFPDVGVLHLLAQAPGETGTHLAMTGSPVSGADAVLLGLADAQVPSDAYGQVVDTLREDPTLGAEALVQRVGALGGDEAESWLQTQRAWVDECYAGDDAALILERLRSRPEPEAREAAQTIASRSPHSVAVTLEALRRAASLDLGGVLAQDLALGPAFAQHPDFAEGVRAQLVDKDRSPRWTHASVADVPRSEVLAAFGPG
ncbi:enoyl-CoA hydratase/isomerase family protein [Ornithinimicrobium pratense]|uniref:3-hydroxyisobutyryl-CoA hydrolase n=1 Tax=Ornithinimicrobium pratense TaxID=2593973 RepID=A0A5J6V172_9MICO|nr:enoyl-CoA hydratase/isomerase family protein [Ornithinimicrobium pratense]QFG67460.1 enoyl-CoA hydratase/isomerase family protein [Ornithinimicrobium pratense]